MSGLDPYEQFEIDVPECDREDVLTMLAEAAHKDGEHESITILDRDHLDAINVRVQGVIKIADNEHSFILQDGNFCGTVLEDWDGPKEFEKHAPTQWALVPNPETVSKAINSDRTAILVLTWDAFLTRKDVADIPGSYSYDRHFQPGVQSEKYWKDKAASFGFVIDTQEEADRVRSTLMEASS